MSTVNGEGTGNAANTRHLNYEALKCHVITHKIDCSLWVIRLLSIIFAVGYFIPVFGNAQNSYQKVLIANAAISALRLHQRLGTVRLSREFLAELLIEDSCHYLFYSLIFLYVPPVAQITEGDRQPMLMYSMIRRTEILPVRFSWITKAVLVVLVPIVLFCILHAASYSLTLLDTLGQNSWWGARLLISLVEFQSLNILRLVAFTEIVLMPYTILLIIMGRASVLTPFIYYHFLTQRYSSRRNPYTRNMFHELRIVFENTAAKPNVPSIVRQALLAIVNFTCKLSPPQTHSPQH